jgi:hypothetical protein
MFTLKSRKDGFRLLLPKEFLCEEIVDKYAQILQNQKSFILSPIAFLNETIQKVQVLGFNAGTIQQQQTSRGESITGNPNRFAQNRFLHTTSDHTYRSEVSPLQLIDKTLNITFKHTLGYVNYFMIFENFWWLYSRDKQYNDMRLEFTIDLLDNNEKVYSRIIIKDPIIDGIDMLDFDYTQPIAESGTFNVIFKYSNIDYQFIDINEE